MKNREKLRLNTNRAERAGRGAPREGQALLTGLVLCGRCGRRMGVRYESRSPRLHYTCYGESGKGVRQCWSVSGRLIDRAVEKLFLKTMVPGELELSLAVEREVIDQAGSLEKAWHARVEQAQYEARRAERRYKAVDPDNRVVARTLEREWEQRLQELAAVEQQRAEARRQHRVELGPEDRKRIRELAHDLPAVWAAPTTNMADRKAMLRLVIEAIALHPLDMPERGTLVRVQWMSGVVNEIKVDRPARGAYHKHAPATLQRIRQLAAKGYRDDQIGQTLDAEGSTTGTGLAWNEERVRAARRAMGAARIAAHRPRKESLPDRLADGRYSVPGLMARLGVAKSVIHAWIRGSVLNASRADHGSHRSVYWIDVDDPTPKETPPAVGAAAPKLESLLGSGRQSSQEIQTTAQENSVMAAGGALCLDILHEVEGRVVHPPGATRRAEAAAFA